MTTTANPRRRPAAEMRRRAAETERHERGDIAYRLFRSAAPGVGAARQVDTPAALTELRGKVEERNGQSMYYTEGYFTRYERGYPMWDIYGEYVETIKRGAGAQTLASNPDVMFLINHTGLLTARTRARTRDATLILEERAEGGWHRAWHNPTREDVKLMMSAIDDELLDEMSFAFQLPEDGGWWSEAFDAFDITKYNIDRGDVSGVNYGANPYTDIAGRAGALLDQLEHLPEGAQREAMARLERRGIAREVVEVRSAGTPQVRSGPRLPKGAVKRRLQARIARTQSRIIDFISPGMGTRAQLEEVVGKLPWYEIRNAKSDGSDAATGGSAQDGPTVFIFDEIGGSFGVSAKKFVQEIEAIDAPQITLRINSPGGSVFDALAIHSGLLHHPARIRVFVDGYACSAASVIAMAGDEIVMMPGSQFMIHDASTTVDGNAAEMVRAGEHLDKQSQNLADIYQRRAGGTADEWRELMLEETWAFAAESVDLGLADRTYDERRTDPGEGLPDYVKAPHSDIAALMHHRHNLGNFGYRFRGREDAPAPTRRARPNLGVKMHPRSGVAVDYDELEVKPTAPPAQPAADNATQDRPKGRSIAYIEAQLDAKLI